MTPVELVVPEVTQIAGASSESTLGLLAQGVMLAAVGVCTLLLVAIRLLRPLSPDGAAKRAFNKAAGAMGLGADERATLEAMSRTSDVEPGALLLSERALRLARVASLASTTEAGPLSSGRIKRACAALGVD
ncbi:MAG: hypothetical protein AAGI53_15455 [Planctomycetota bacterium]